MKTICFVPAVTLATLGALMVPGKQGLRAQDASVEKSAVSGEALSKVSAGTEGAVSSVSSGGNSTSTVAFPGKTLLDDPGANDDRLAVPIDSKGKTIGARLSKIDLDGDLDYDGTINNADPSDQGRVEFIPPGFEVGVGEVTRLVLRHKIYEEDFPGDLDVTLEVAQVNRDSASGSFASGGGSQAGRIKVWRDQARSELILDSGDSTKLSKTWTYEKGKLSGGIPRTVYVEAVEVSPKSEGDIRVMVVAEHRPDGATTASKSSLYQPAFDHMLFTVRKEALPKEFINNNVEGVWSTVGGQVAAGAR